MDKREELIQELKQQILSCKMDIAGGNEINVLDALDTVSDIERLIISKSLQTENTQVSDDVLDGYIERFEKGAKIHEDASNNSSLSPTEKNRESYLLFHTKAFISVLKEIKDKLQQPTEVKETNLSDLWRLAKKYNCDDFVNMVNSTQPHSVDKELKRTFLFAEWLIANYTESDSPFRELKYISKGGNPKERSIGECWKIFNDLLALQNTNKDD